MQVWSEALQGLSISDFQDLSQALTKRGSDGWWQGDHGTAGVDIPPAGWAPIQEQPTQTIPPAVIALWGERFSPVQCTVAEERWCWWRDGDQAVLQHLTPNGTPDWWVVIDSTGIRTARPEWGVWWRHSVSASLIAQVMESAPSPTWLPL